MRYYPDMEEGDRTEIAPATQSLKDLLAPITKQWRKVSFLMPWILTLIFTGGIAAVTAHHEMWRDEIQAWLLARDSLSPLELLHNIRYEGHPGLWHLILWPIAQCTGNPIGMQVAHVLIAGASALILLRRAPLDLGI